MWAEFAGEVENLAGLAAGVGGAARCGLGALEAALRMVLLRLGTRLCGGLLAGDTGYVGSSVDCGGGHRARFVEFRDKTITTVVGPVPVRRAYYHCARCRVGVVPRDAVLGVAGMSLSPGLRAMVAHTAVAVPFATAADLVAELAGVTVSASQVERVTEADGAAARAAVVAESAAILAGRTTPPPPPETEGEPAADLLYLAIDGTGVPMRPAETAGRAGKGPDGRARTREVKLAVVFTQSSVDEKGRPVRDPGSSTYLASFDPAEAFGGLVAAEARRRGIDHVRQPVVLGDGAPWIWNLATARFPQATQIVDLFHAREHLHELADYLAFIVPDPDDWRTQRLADLDAGDIEAIVTAAREYPMAGTKKDELDTKLGYFTTNAHRMRYAYFRSLGMFVGSGAVEAGCKHVIGDRLKQSGMRWSLAGADAIIHLRCQDLSGRWDQVWSTLDRTTAA